jgi:hypothetical protein
VLLAPGVSAYPFRPSDLDDLEKLAPTSPMPEGIVAVRLPHVQAP